MFTVARGLFNLLLLKTMRSKSLDWLYRQFNRPWDYGYRDRVSLTQAVILLNELVKADPETMQALLEARVPCGASLARHPSIQLLMKDGRPRVGLLGVLNSLFGKGADGQAQIIAESDGTNGRLCHFWTREDWNFQMDLAKALREMEEKSAEK